MKLGLSDKAVRRIRAAGQKEIQEFYVDRTYGVFFTQELVDDLGLTDPDLDYNVFAGEILPCKIVGFSNPRYSSRDYIVIVELVNDEFGISRPGEGLWVGVDDLVEM